MSPYLLLVERAVQEEGCALLGIFEHVVLLEEGEVVTGDKVGRGDQVGCADLLLAEAQMTGGHTAGLLGVVDEICLNFVVGAVADNLDRVLVGANGSIGTEAVEHCRVAVERNLVVRIEVEAATGDVILDADHAVVHRLVFGQVVENGLGHAGAELVGAEAVTGPNDLRVTFEGDQAVGHCLAKGGAHVVVERLAYGAWLLGAVEDRDLFGGRGQCFGKGLNIEGQEEADFDQANFLALRDQVLDQFVHGVTA